MYSICVKQDILVGNEVTFLQVQKCRGLEMSIFNVCLGQGKEKILLAQMTIFTRPIIQRGIQKKILVQD